MKNALTVVQELYQAIGTGDIERIVSLLSPKIEWTEAERFPYYGGVWREPQQVIDNLFVPLVRDWDGFSVTPKEFITDGNQVVSLGEYAGTYRATNRRMSALFAHRWVVRDEKIVQFNQYTDTAKVLEATI
jgi:uncharacterized protein